jgi:predicted Zn-dependent peptidase
MNARQIETSTLTNGIRLISEQMPHVRSVSVGIWIGTGSRRETAKQNGISHFVEHMVFKGSSKRSAEEIARVVDSCGGNLDAYTAKELVSYSSKVMDEHLPLAFDVLSDLVQNPRFEESDIEKEKGVILEELKMDVDNPEYLVHESFASNFWKNHPLGRPILGTKATIKSFNRSDLVAYHQEVYAPKNLVITAAGHLEHAAIVELAERHFSGLKDQTPAPPTEPPVPRAPLILKNKRSLEQVHLCLGVPAYPLDHERRYGCYVLSTILGGGMSSRLFQNIREKNGLAYSVFSELSLYRDSGCLFVYGGTSQENARKVVDMTLAEFRTLQKEPVPAEELRRAKDHLKGSLALSLESTSSRMSNLARQELFFQKFFTVDEMVDSIERVTSEEVQEIANDFFNGRQVGLTLLGRLNGFAIQPEELIC